MQNLKKNIKNTNHFEIYLEGLEKYAKFFLNSMKSWNNFKRYFEGSEGLKRLKNNYIHFPFGIFVLFGRKRIFSKKSKTILFSQKINKYSTEIS